MEGMIRRFKLKLAQLKERRKKNKKNIFVYNVFPPVIPKFWCWWNYVGEKEKKILKKCDLLWNEREREKFKKMLTPRKKNPLDFERKMSMFYLKKNEKKQKVNF